MEETQQFRLTTFDNPFDPFEEFEEWFRFDIEKGYNTCSVLGRIANIGDDFTEKETDEAINKAIDQIILNDFMNIYKKVQRKTVSVA